MLKCQWDSIKTKSNFVVNKFPHFLYVGLVSANYKRHGVGIQIYTSGRFYEGEWYNDEFNGWGIHYAEEGEVW